MDSGSLNPMGKMAIAMLFYLKLFLLIVLAETFGLEIPIWFILPVNW
jgi:hypothetical protein